MTAYDFELDFFLHLLPCLFVSCGLCEQIHECTVLIKYAIDDCSDEPAHPLSFARVSAPCIHIHVVKIVVDGSHLTMDI